MKKLRQISVMAIMLFFALFSLSLISCESDDDGQAMEHSVSLDVADIITLNRGDEITVSPQFQPDIVPQRAYSWSASNSGVVTISVMDNYSAVIEAVNAGSTVVTFSSNDQEIYAEFLIEVPSDYENDNIIKVLAIGNSFSEDAIENYLFELASTENVQLIIGNLYIGGASLDLHWQNAQENNRSYEYRKITPQGKWVLRDTNIETGLLDEDWDYISFQQVSNHSGQYETYLEPLTNLLDYTKNISTNPDAKYWLHQTWAYSVTSTHSGFSNYNNDQETMYEAITETARKVKIALDLDYVVPAGTAIQNARQTFLGNAFTRDGYHLSLSLGRYTAASTWFEALTGISAVGNSFGPSDMNETEITIAQLAAHSAILNPDSVTLLEDYLPEDGGGSSELKAAININFGNNTADNWNTLNDHHEGAAINNLKDIEDDFTNISVTVTQRFNARNGDGEKNTNTDLNMPEAVSGQSYYGNSRGVWQSLEIKQSQLTFQNLNPDHEYELCFFSSRAGVSDNRETKFIVSGENTTTVNLQSSSNSTEIVCASNIQPDSDGIVRVTVTAGDNNNNGSGFYYLNAMRITNQE